IGLFAVSGRLPAAFGPTILLALGAAGAVVRWSAMALARSLAALPALQCLHALSFGATHLGVLGFVARIALAGQGLRCGATFRSCWGAMAAGMGLSGLLYWTLRRAGLCRDGARGVCRRSLRASGEADDGGWTTEAR